AILEEKIKCLLGQLSIHPSRISLIEKLELLASLIRYIRILSPSRKESISPPAVFGIVALREIVSRDFRQNIRNDIAIISSAGDFIKKMELVRPFKISVRW
ncbi:hypothetical protein PENTCL1PPCAC_23662, partial [Pristionchus entomophagus]